MKLRLPWYLITAFLTFTLTAFSQGNREEVESIYGLDPTLFNGEIYKYYLPQDTKGDQFLQGSLFRPGEITIKGVTYTDVAMNYDIYNQQVLVQYENREGKNILKVPLALVRDFSIEKRHFEVIPLQDTNRLIVQVFGKGKYRILKKWVKTQKIVMTYTVPYYEFSPARYQYYLEKRSSREKFRSNRNFISLLDPAVQDAARKYLRKHKIVIRKAGDTDLLEFISYCNSL